ncbi:MAG: hypothetical protein ACLSHO_05390 [Dysosmobacter sp.]
MPPLVPALAAIQLLELPTSTAGVLYVWLLCGGYSPANYSYGSDI